MESVEGNLYDYPRYYDLVFGSDWKAEFDFLCACFQRHAVQPARRLFEPACGTGRLLYRLAKAGYEICGLDLNAHAVRYCNERLRRHGLPATAGVGDMTAFRLPRRVDAAFNMINSFRHLPSERQALAHLRCMARALRPGGLYILGLHLTPTRGAPMDEESWSARRGNLVVNTHLATTHRDLQLREERLRMTCDVYTPTRFRRIEDTVLFRTYTAAQLRQLLADSGVFEIAETYDFAYQVERPISVSGETEDVIYVLRKRCGSA